MDRCHPHHERRYKPLVLDLPFGRKLIWDGRGLSLKDGRKVDDGTYGLVVFKDGVPVDVLPQPLPVFTPPPCVPQPEPCSDGDGSGSVELDPSAANLSRWNETGRLLTTLSVVAGDHVNAAGHGTAWDPLRLSLSLPQSRLALQSVTTDVLPVTGSGDESSPYQIRHAKPAGFTGGPGFGGFAFDSYGHAIGYIEPPAAGVNQITVAPGTLTAQPDTGVVVMSLAELHSGALSVELVDGTLAVDMFGRVTGFSPTVRQPDAWRFVVGLATGTEVEIEFATTYAGQIRGTALGLPLTNATAVSQPSGYSAVLDGTVVNCWSVLGRLEMKTIAVVDAGDHALTLTVPASVSTPVIVDLSLCQ